MRRFERRCRRPRAPVQVGAEELKLEFKEGFVDLGGVRMPVKVDSRMETVPKTLFYDMPHQLALLALRLRLPVRSSTIRARRRCLQRQVPSVVLRQLLLCVICSLKRV